MTTKGKTIRRVAPFTTLDKEWKDAFFKKLRMKLQHEKKVASYHAHTCLTSNEELRYSLEVLHVKALLLHLKRKSLYYKIDVMYSLLDTLGENTMKHTENAFRQLLYYIGTSKDPLTLEDVVYVCQDYIDYVLSFREQGRK